MEYDVEDYLGTNLVERHWTSAITHNFEPFTNHIYAIPWVLGTTYRIDEAM